MLCKFRATTTAVQIPPHPRSPTPGQNGRGLTNTSPQTPPNRGRQPFFSGSQSPGVIFCVCSRACACVSSFNVLVCLPWFGVSSDLIVGSPEVHTHEHEQTSRRVAKPAIKDITSVLFSTQVRCVPSVLRSKSSTLTLPPHAWMCQRNRERFAAVLSACTHPCAGVSPVLLCMTRTNAVYVRN